MIKEIIEQRIMDQIHFSEKGCWLWTASLTDQGYAQFTVDGKCKKLHRWFYQYLYGPVPEGLCLDHLCRRRNCINPFHLEPVTLRENILRGEGASARHARQIACIRGHSFDGKWRSRRRCSKCTKIRNDIFNKKKGETLGLPRATKIKEIVRKRRLSSMDSRVLAFLCRDTQRPLQYVRFDGFKSGRERNYWYSMLWRRYSRSYPENFVRMVKYKNRKNLSAKPFYKELAIS